MTKLDGLDSCIIGVCCKCGQDDVLLYSTAKVIALLMRRGGMTWSEAEEFYCANILGLWSGPGTPAFMDTYLEGGDVHCGDVVEHNRRVSDS